MCITGICLQCVIFFMRGLHCDYSIMCTMYFKQVQPALCMHGFSVCRFNHSQIKNIFKNPRYWTCTDFCHYSPDNTVWQPLTQHWHSVRYHKSSRDGLESMRGCVQFYIGAWSSVDFGSVVKFAYIYMYII
jgi:hypothetical protein